MRAQGILIVVLCFAHPALAKEEGDSSCMEAVDSPAFRWQLRHWNDNLYSLYGRSPKARFLYLRTRIHPFTRMRNLYTTDIDRLLEAERVWHDWQVRHPEDTIEAILGYGPREKMLFIQARIRIDFRRRVRSLAPEEMIDLMDAEEAWIQAAKRPLATRLSHHP